MVEEEDEDEPETPCVTVAEEEEVFDMYANEMTGTRHRQRRR